MDDLEVIARLRIRPGQSEKLLAQAAQLVRLTRDLDTKTLRYDWFINADRTLCEVHEAYTSPTGLVEHNAHILEARTVLLRDCVLDHQMTAFGAISNELRELGRKHAGGMQEFSLVDGLERLASQDRSP